MATRFFSAAEIRELESWPVEVGRDELARCFRLAAEDVDWVNRTARSAPAKLGLAVQLCALPWLGFVPDDVKATPPAAVSRVATHLGVSAGALAHYGRRAQTRSDHVRLVAKRLGWRTVEDDDRAGWKALREFLVDRDVPDEVEKVRLGLVELLPRIPITELLIEVDRWTGFSDHLAHAGGKLTRDNALRSQLYAAILAQGANFGITAMAQACGLGYDTLA